MFSTRTALGVRGREGERCSSRRSEAVTWFFPWVAGDLHMLLSAGKRINSRCERNQAAVVKR